MAHPTSDDIRELLLSAVREVAPPGRYDGAAQQGTVFKIVSEKLKLFSDPETEQFVLTEWHDLFRTGYLAWGLNLGNANAPFFHLTNRGKQALERLSHDPSNPAGYKRHLDSIAILSPIARSYLLEALACFNADLHKAAAVMLGAAAESLALELRDLTTQRLKVLSKPVPKGLADWRIKTVLDALHSFLNTQSDLFPRELREEFEAYFLAFAQQIRASRNDAGHPSSVDPVTEQGVHASFLLFPDLVRLSVGLSAWVNASLV
jgi:hypothetical protein